MPFIIAFTSNFTLTICDDSFCLDESEILTLILNSVHFTSQCQDNCIWLLKNAGKKLVNLMQRLKNVLVMEHLCSLVKLLADSADGGMQVWADDLSCPT